MYTQINVDVDDSGEDGERGREVVIPAWLGVIGPVNSLISFCNRYIPWESK